MPKTVDTARRSESMPQPNPYILVLGGCGRLLHVLTPPHSAFLYLQFLARCHPYILLQIFILVEDRCCEGLTQRNTVASPAMEGGGGGGGGGWCQS